MCTTEEKQEKVLAKDISENLPIANPCCTEQSAERSNLDAKEKVKQYYLDQANKWCPNLAPDCTDEHRLRMLHRKMKHIVKALTNFDRPWEKGIGKIEKTYLRHLILQEMPPTERGEMFEEFATWLDFLMTAAFHRSFVTQVLQDYCRQLRQLENFMGYKTSVLPTSSFAPED